MFDEILRGEVSLRGEKRKQHKILVVDDDPNIRELIVETLNGDKYKTVEARDGMEALQMCEVERPDIVVLDVMMPDLDGLEVCLRLRGEALTKHIPIILLTAKGLLEDKIRGMDTGADDYMTKPFDPLELEARISMHLRRSIRDGEASPLTGLPGNRAIEEAIESRINAGLKFAVCYIDLDEFKAYNDRYGFHAGSGVIKMTSEAILEAVDKYGDPEDFIGHIGGDDFIVVTEMERAPLLSQEIIRLFDRRIPEHYENEDRERGAIVSTDRQGNINEFPIMTISIAITHNTYRNLDHPGKVAQIAAELKKYAKSMEGSNFVFDRRRRD
ncbi:MAG: response regulator [Actinobacteria bacterium]|nr:response regulator [Actinomycetota bacterium]